MFHFLKTVSAANLKSKCDSPTTIGRKPKTVDNWMWEGLSLGDLLVTGSCTKVESKCNLLGSMSTVFHKGFPYLCKVIFIIKLQIRFIP